MVALLMRTRVAVIVQVRTLVASVFACYTALNHVPSNGVVATMSLATG